MRVPSPVTGSNCRTANADRRGSRQAASLSAVIDGEIVVLD